MINVFILTLDISISKSSVSSIIAGVYSSLELAIDSAKNSSEYSKKGYSFRVEKATLGKRAGHSQVSKILWSSKK